MRGAATQAMRGHRRGAATKQMPARRRGPQAHLVALLAPYMQPGMAGPPDPVLVARALPAGLQQNAILIYCPALILIRRLINVVVALLPCFRLLL